MSVPSAAPSVQSRRTTSGPPHPSTLPGGDAFGGDRERRPGAWRTAVARCTAGAITVMIVASGNAMTRPLLGLLLVCMLWLIVTSALAVRWGWTPGQVRAIAVSDLVLLLVVAAVTGGAESDVRFILWLAPLAWATSFDRTSYLAMVALPPVSYLLMWLLGGGADTARSIGDLAVFGGMYGGAVVVGILALQLRIQTTEQAAMLQRARIALIHELSLVERDEHERMSAKLHDGPLQAFISARQDLDEHRDGDRDALELAISTLDDGIVGLRTVVGEIFPTDLTDLATRIDEICRRYEQRSTFAVDLHVDPSVAGAHDDIAHDDMLVGIVGELIANVAKHARATRLYVAVGPCEDGVAIDVRDDGIGMAASDHKRAAEAGHIGLSSLDRRIRALGGRWQIRSAPGRGTSVHVELPR
ncbi:MAG: hypothetical protein ITG02_04575 [Patulibacter sp.]|nr:hypothetical protein [Patulibacter sp.]